MGVGTWTDPNPEVLVGMPLKGAIQNSLAVAERLARAFAPHESDPPDMTVALDAGHLFAAGTLTEVAAQTTVEIEAPTVNPRIDRVVIDAATGMAEVVEGDEDPDPEPPAIPAGKLPVARVALAVDQTFIWNGDITDERAGAGGGGGLTPGASTELTIAMGVVTATGSHHSVDTESGAASDDLDTITVTALAEGQLLVLKAENAARVVTVKNGTGNITLANGDCLLNTAAKRLVLQKVGSNLVEVARSPSYFESSEQTAAADTLLTVAHGLGALPKQVQVSLRCKTTDGGYAVGDELLLSGYGSHTGAADGGVEVGFNATNVFVVQGTEIRLLGKSNFDNTLITLSNWRWIVRAWA